MDFLEFKTEEKTVFMLGQKSTPYGHIRLTVRAILRPDSDHNPSGTTVFTS